MADYSKIDLSAATPEGFAQWLKTKRGREASKRHAAQWDAIRKQAAAAGLTLDEFMDQEAKHVRK